MTCFDTGDSPAIEHLLEGLPAGLFSDEFFRLCELTDRYGLELAVSQFHALELAPAWGSSATAAQLLERRRFSARFGPALDWILRRLAAAELLTQAPAAGAEGQIAHRSTAYCLHGKMRDDLVAAVRSAALETDPRSAPTFDLLDAAAAVYPSVARGEASGEQLLFEDPSMIALWLAYFDNANALYAINNHVSAHAAAARLAGRERLRILEVGAGAASASQCLVEVLRADGMLERVERYTVTEPNPLFRRRGQRALKARCPGLPVRFCPLDIDAPWADQLDDAAPYDLVFGVNVMHLAKELEESLDQARTVLRRGGAVVLGECIRPFEHQPVWAEFVFQILDGFLAVRTNPLTRPAAGFQTAQRWRAALSQAGFDSVEMAPDVEAIRPVYPRFYTGAVCGLRPT